MQLGGERTVCGARLGTSSLALGRPRSCLEGRMDCAASLSATSRRSEGLEALSEVVIIDIETLVATLGYDFRLETLPSRMQCPRCHSHLIEMEWVVPDTTPAPFAPAADVVPLRLKPTPAEKALRTLRVVGSGRSRSQDRD